MDFMKVFDQAVREITREVNTKILKVPEIEQKVLDATCNEPWGPHGSDMAEIARATKNYTDSQLIMNVLWTRLTDTGRYWRHVYKALTVIEYLVSHGADRVVDEIIQNSYRISSIAEFEYVESNGKDMGLNVRNKVQTVLALLNDKDKIKEVREKATTNRDKYFGLSSTGITYKSSSSVHSGSGFYGSERDDSIGDSYRRKVLDGAHVDRKTTDKYKDSIDQDVTKKVGRDKSTETKGSSSKNGVMENRSTVSKTVKSHLSSESHDMEDEFDDFDPRGSSTDADFNPRGGSSTVGPAKPSQENLFSKNMLDDLIDINTVASTENDRASHNPVSEVDLFADASFVSASPSVDAGSTSHSQEKLNLFAHQPVTSVMPTPPVDLFASSESAFPSSSKPSSENAIDPFASVPLINFQDGDLFGAFTSSTESMNVASSSANDPLAESKGNAVADYQNEQLKNSGTDTKSPLKKDAFQIKSSIWADSLSRGLIDLNISAPTKVSLVDIGIVRGLDDLSEPRRDEKDFVAPSFQMGKAMGVGSGLGRTGFTSTTGGAGSFIDLSNQFDSFK